MGAVADVRLRNAVTRGAVADEAFAMQSNDKDASFQSLKPSPSSDVRELLLITEEIQLGKIQAAEPLRDAELLKGDFKYPKDASLLGGDFKDADFVATSLLSDAERSSLVDQKPGAEGSSSASSL